MKQEDLSRIERFRQFRKQIRGSDKYLTVGIDVAKSKHYATFATTQGRIGHKGLVFENNASGFEHLLTQVQFYQDRDGFEQVVFGLEPTSVYQKPLAEFLIQQDYLVVYVTNEAIKDNRRTLDGRWDKHDKKDSANVADLVGQGKCQYYDLPNIDLRDIRNLLLLRKRLKKQLHGCRIRIRNNLVAQYFPELDRLWHQCEAENLAIVRWCLSPAKINQLRFEDFFQMVTTGTKGVRQYQRLRKIWEMAPYSIGCRPGQTLELEAQIMVGLVEYIKKQLDQVQKMIEDLCRSFVEYEYLLSIPGFGSYIAATVLAAIGNPLRFNKASELIRLAGFDLSAKRSGKTSSSAVPVISKKGKVELRYALYQAALIASSRTPRFKTYFHRVLEGRQREKGIRTKMRVKLAVKLLVIAWTLMKKREYFDPDCITI
jgi:transposase